MMRLELENGTVETVPDANRVRQLLATLCADGNSFAILSSGEHDYIQTQLTDGVFVLEKRCGGAGSHFEATHLAPRRVQLAAKPWWKFWGESPTGECFRLEEITAAFIAYLSGAPDPAFFQWNRVQV